MFTDPEEIIADLPLEKNMAVADFGCGSGSWVLPLAERLEDGVIYAIDIMKEPLSVLRSDLSRKGISNVKVMNENIEKGVSISDERVDLVLMTIFLFQVDDKSRVLEEAERILKPGGLLLITEWAEESSFGKSLEKVSPEKVKELAEEKGFRLEKEFQSGMHQYGLIFKK